MKKSDAANGLYVSRDVYDEQIKKVARLEAEVSSLKNDQKRRFSEIAALTRMLESASSKSLQPAGQGSIKSSAFAKTLEGLKRIKLNRKGQRSPKVDNAVSEIRRSGLFDEEWYLDNYPDVRIAGLDPVEHYVRHGAGEGRDPSPLFSTLAYVQKHSGGLAGENPLVHHLKARAVRGGK